MSPVFLAYRPHRPGHHDRIVSFVLQPQISHALLLRNTSYLGRLIPHGLFWMETIGFDMIRLILGYFSLHKYAVFWISALNTEIKGGIYVRTWA